MAAMGSCTRVLRSLASVPRPGGMRGVWGLPRLGRVGGVRGVPALRGVRGMRGLRGMSALHGARLFAALACSFALTFGSGALASADHGHGGGSEHGNPHGEGSGGGPGSHGPGSHGESGAGGEASGSGHGNPHGEAGGPNSQTAPSTSAGGPAAAQGGPGGHGGGSGHHGGGQRHGGGEHGSAGARHGEHGGAGSGHGEHGSGGGGHSEHGSGAGGHDGHAPTTSGHSGHGGHASSATAGTGAQGSGAGGHARGSSSPVATATVSTPVATASVSAPSTGSSSSGASPPTPQSTAASTTPASTTPAAATPGAPAAPSAFATPLATGAAAQTGSARAASKLLPGGAAIAAQLLSAGPAAGAFSAPIAPAESPSAAGARSRTRALRTRNEPTTGPLPPLVRTITRIVGVVPLALRILVGLLAALALALAARSRLAASRTRRLERHRSQLLEDVGLLQAALLPIPPERIGPVGASVAYRPADGPAAGGDFYDVFALDAGLVAAIVGDVSGHGRGALPHTALVRFTLRAYLEAGLSPREALQTAGTVLERQLGDSFATVLAATYDPRERLLTYAGAGHPPPLVLGARPQGSPDPPALEPVTVCSAPPLAAGLRTGTRQTIVSVPGSAQVCLHTDGITEARVGYELYGRERLRRALSSLDDEASAPALLERVVEGTDARPDDMAACLLSIEGGLAEPRVLVEQLELDPAQAAGERAKRFLQACGVERGEIAELLPRARARAERAGTALIEVSFVDGAPVTRLHSSTVAPIAIAQAKRSAAMGAAR